MTQNSGATHNAEHRPAELPFEQPTESFLAINLKTAARLGVAVPQDLLLQANWTN